MALIPPPDVTIASLIDSAQKLKRETPRSHLGASELGEKCERKMWLKFRWAYIEEFEGRMLRLFKRGHDEEEKLHKLLESIGVVFEPTEIHVDFGSHVSGTADRVISHGVLGAPKKRHLGEFKTHNDKSFKDLKKKGVQESKPSHYVQMQVYMLGSGIDRCLYVAINKNDDEIHAERVKLDKEFARKMVERGQRIALTERMPPPMSTDPSWWECKFCAGWDICHGTKTTKEISCRTCAHVTPKPDSTWHCARWDGTVPYKFQLQGCPSHTMHPDLVPWDMVDSEHEWSATYSINGEKVINGEDGLTSKRLLGCEDG